MVKLTVIPVIPLALSEAMNTPTLAISSSVISRRGWVEGASSMFALPSKADMLTTGKCSPTS